MRYIDKRVSSPARNLLSAQRALLQSAGQLALYANLDINPQTGKSVKEDLNDYLRQEQGNLCCYCEQRITHFQQLASSGSGGPDTGSHNEHYYPEATYPNKQLDYDNLFACCNRSKGLSKALQHCGEHKADSVPNDLFRNPKCQSYFRYNANGEILPDGSWSDWKSVEKAAVQGQLTPGEQQAFNLIKLLNLNLFALVSLRKKVCNIVFASLQNKSKQQINRMVQNLNRTSEKVEFISLQIYFCKRLALSAP